MSKQLLASVVCVCLTLAFVVCDKEPVAVGNGLSSLTDAQAAGADAATKAKAALGSQSAKAVIVYNSRAIKEIEKMLEGVGSVFDSSVVYGCGGYAPLTQESSAGSVGVLAIAGSADVTVARAALEGKDGFEACGVAIGNELKAATQTDASGRLMLLFGECHVPQNDKLVAGVRSVLGDDFPIVGGAAANGKVYDKGKVYTKSNLGVLITGNFKCGFSTKKDMTADGLINSARDAFAEAIGDNKEKVKLMFAFDCGGRRGAMQKNNNFPKELEAMKSVSGDIPIFGFYGSGEIGRASNSEPARGVGYSIAACAISAE